MVRWVYAGDGVVQGRKGDETEEIKQPLVQGVPQDFRSAS